jgi:signal transduction histidine kinase
VGNHLPLLSIFEYGWEFSLSAILGVTILRAALGSRKELETDLAPVNSIRTVTGGLGLGSMCVLMLLTWFTLSQLDQSSPNTAASYVLIFAALWATTSIGSLILSQRVRKLYENLLSREHSVESVPSGLSWEVREIYGLLRARNVELQTERDRVLKITSTVAHNIRSPLLALRTVLPILTNSIGHECGCNEVIKSHVDTLNFAMKTIESTADELLNERKRISHSEPLAGTIRGAVNIANLKYPDKSFEIEMDDSLIGPRIEGLSSSLINLLSNAAEATSNGQPIGVSVKVSDSDIEVTVKDQGAGMSSKLIKSLLAGKTVTTKANGNGLGVTSSLSWAKSNSYGLRISSQEGKGSQFSIIVPFSRVGTNTLAPELQKRFE